MENEKIVYPNRECSECKHFWFDRLRYGCEAGESAVPSGMWGAHPFTSKTCLKFIHWKKSIRNKE